MHVSIIKCSKAKQKYFIHAVPKGQDHVQHNVLALGVKHLCQSL